MPSESSPPVSVIIPVYNRPRLAVEAVRSVLFQSYTRLECILVDDGSTEPPDEARRIFSADPRFRYIRNEHTGMPGAARNCGVEQARYDLIAFLDSDDIWLPEKLACQVGLLAGNSRTGNQPEAKSRAGQPAQHSCTALIHTREIWLRGHKIISQKTQRHRRSGNVFADALEKCMIGPSTVLMQRKIFEELGGFREDLEIAEDYEFWLRLTAMYEVDYIDTPQVVKRAGHGEQLSEKYGQIEIFRLRGLHDLVRSGWFLRSYAEAASASGSAAARSAADMPASDPAGADIEAVDIETADMTTAWLAGAAHAGAAHAGAALKTTDMAAAELSRKAAIYAAGCRKRGRIEEAEKYERLSREYSTGP